MPYVIASACIDVNDKSCVEECPVDCIYEGERKSYINPKECIDCGACEPVCPVEAISQDRRVAEDDEQFVEDNRRVLHRGAARPRRAARRARAAPARSASSAPTPRSCSGLEPDARRSPARRRPRARPGARVAGAGLARLGARLRARTASSRTCGTPTACPRPGRLDELFEEQGVDHALLFCEYSPEGHRLPALRGPAADRRAQPGPVPPGRERQPAPALPDRRRGTAPARPRRGGAQAAPGARRLPLRRPRRSTRPTRCSPSAACRWSCTAAPAPSPAR